MHRMIAGSILLLASAAFFSYEKIRSERLRYTGLQDWLSFLTFAENQIRSFRTPYPEIFTFFREQEDTAFAHSLAQIGLTAQLSASTLPSGAIPLLREYVAKAGSHYEAEEVRLCGYTITALQTILDAEKKNLREKTKLYRTLPLMLALSIVLLFL